MLSLSIEQARADAHHLLYGAEPGALGQTLEAAGKRTAVIANADGGPPAGSDAMHREAALAVMDEAGQVAGGVVDRSLAVTDPTAAGGYRMADGAVLDAFDRAWAADDVVLVELSDLERLDRNGIPTDGPERQAALRPVLRRGRRTVRPAPRPGRPEPGPGAAGQPGGARRLRPDDRVRRRGPGFTPGEARSATTRRDGYVTLPDVGITVLDSFGLRPPDSMNGTAITSGGGRPFVAHDAQPGGARRARRGTGIGRSARSAWCTSCSRC